MKNKLNFIDALRGWAIFGVILIHSSSLVTDHSSQLFKLVFHGSRGVQLFYVASALTLFYSLRYSHKAEANQTLNFFIRRFFRIAPLFYFALLCYLALGILIGSIKSFQIWKNLLFDITFLNGFSPYYINSFISIEWSIGVEMGFYLLVPWLYSRIKALPAALLALIASLVLRFAFVHFGHRYPLIHDQALWNQFLGLSLPSQLPVFCLGFVLFYLLEAHHFQQARSSAGQYLAGSLLTVSLAGMAYLLADSETAFFTNAFLYGACFVLFAWALALNPFRLFVNSAMMYLGKISYSAYLSHLLAIALASAWIAPFVRHFASSSVSQYIILFGSVLTITALISTFTYRYIELPGIQFGKKLINYFERRHAEGIHIPAARSL